jgi:hypothetical protein
MVLTAANWRGADPNRSESIRIDLNRSESPEPPPFPHSAAKHDPPLSPLPPPPLQTAFAMARASGLLAGLRGAERLTLFLAALCHDIEHPGVSASFLLR